ncbi:hypothetical protein EPN96_06670 [bacterium]|nr:MAG: hypothetical protein EPN96_06670 [bacterium]
MTEEQEVHYDIEEAAKEVASRTGQKIETVEDILEAEFLFNAALGFYEIPDDKEGEEFMEELLVLRQKHSDILPPADANIEEYEDIEDRLVTFITRLTGAEPTAIEEVLDEHILYLEEKGILEPVEED